MIQKKSDQSRPRALAALNRAAKSALELARKTGTACYVEKDGKIIDIARDGDKKVGRASAKPISSKSRRPATKRK